MRCVPEQTRCHRCGCLCRRTAGAEMPQRIKTHSELTPRKAEMPHETTGIRFPFRATCCARPATVRRQGVTRRRSKQSRRMRTDDAATHRHHPDAPPGAVECLFVSPWKRSRHARVKRERRWLVEAATARRRPRARVRLRCGSRIQRAGNRHARQRICPDRATYRMTALD